MGNFYRNPFVRGPNAGSERLLVKEIWEYGHEHQPNIRCNFLDVNLFRCATTSRINQERSIVCDGKSPPHFQCSSAFAGNGIIEFTSSSSSYSIWLELGLPVSPDSSFLANLPRTRGRLSARVFRHTYCDFLVNVSSPVVETEEAAYFESRVIQRGHVRNRRWAAARAHQLLLLLPTLSKHLLTCLHQGIEGYIQ